MTQNGFLTRTPPGGILGENSKIRQMRTMPPHPVNMCTKFQKDPIQTVGEDSLSVGQSRKTVAFAPAAILDFSEISPGQKLPTTTVHNPTKFQGIPSSGFPSRPKRDFGQERHLVAF